VIAQNGTVTLKGPVRSEEEKKSIEAKAAEVAGAGNVQNELSIAPKGKS
jgi:osmotically-inducible protein OsmY